jgi:hypothetical protein
MPLVVELGVGLGVWTRMEWVCLLEVMPFGEEGYCGDSMVDIEVKNLAKIV